VEAELRRIAEFALPYAGDGEELTGIVPAEPSPGTRVYLCAFGRGEETSWLLLDADGSPVEERARVREAVSIAALWELALELRGEEPAGEVASPELLDRAGSEDFAQAVLQATETVEELVRDVERGYKVPLS
jgi:hypothetical protein